MRKIYIIEKNKAIIQCCKLLFAIIPKQLSQYVRDQEKQLQKNRNNASQNLNEINT